MLRLGKPLSHILSGGYTMDKPTDICEEIELKRLEMHEAGTLHGLMSPEVLRVSQELDLLLNDFNKRLNRECG
ncbi:hypothetical protein CA599_28480 [Paenibacillus taichungensis]|nr:hypothetical protein CA599_28480 [Paenibacillus taichungensis]